MQETLDDGSSRMMDQDNTFKTVCMYGSVAWAATVMGVSKDTFYRKRKEWATQGFPEPDPINGHYIKADVETWVANRRSVANRGIEESFKPGKANFDAL